MIPDPDVTSIADKVINLLYSTLLNDWAKKANRYRNHPKFITIYSYPWFGRFSILLYSHIFEQCSYNKKSQIYQNKNNFVDF